MMYITPTCFRLAACSASQANGSLEEEVVQAREEARKRAENLAEIEKNGPIRGSAAEKVIRNLTCPNSPRELPPGYVGLRKQVRKAEDYAARVMKRLECPGSQK